MAYVTALDWNELIDGRMGADGKLLTTGRKKQWITVYTGIFSEFFLVCGRFGPNTKRSSPSN
jgi:hypothetical protein